VLQGSEIKSIRAGHVNLKDAYAKVRTVEAWLFNCHIASYTAASYNGHEPGRARKLLLHRKEVDEIDALTKQKSLTLFRFGCTLRVVSRRWRWELRGGKKQYDKREAIAQRDQDSASWTA
jgi:SsrA-binding protein